MPNIAFHLLAATTSDDVFKSMGETMGSDINPAQVLAVIAAVVGLAVLLSVFKRKADRAPRQAETSHPGRLLRQLAREAGLSRRDVRELKRLATLQGVQHPITLLLCPSLMQAAIAKKRAAKAS